MHSSMEKEVLSNPNQSLNTGITVKESSQKVLEGKNKVFGGT